MSRKMNVNDIFAKAEKLGWEYDEAKASLTKAQERLDHFVTEMETTAVHVKRIARQMDSKEGTMGMLIKDRSLYDGLITTFTDLDSLIHDIKTNPKKYIHVSVF